jgi:hypothetical protein
MRAKFSAYNLEMQEVLIGTRAPATATSRSRKCCNSCANARSPKSA